MILHSRVICYRDHRTLQRAMQAADERHAAATRTKAEHVCVLRERVGYVPARGPLVTLQLPGPV
jgi:hypothetical protein